MKIFICTKSSNFVKEPILPIKIYKGSEIGPSFVLDGPLHKQIIGNIKYISLKKKKKKRTDQKNGTCAKMLIDYLAVEVPFSSILRTALLLKT